MLTPGGTRDPMRTPAPGRTDTPLPVPVCEAGVRGSPYSEARFHDPPDGAGPQPFLPPTPHIGVMTIRPSAPRMVEDTAADPAGGEDGDSERGGSIGPARGSCLETVGTDSAPSGDQMG